MLSPEQIEKLTPKVDTAGFNEDQLRATEKYPVDGPFKEPVLRCDSCSNLVLATTLREIGMCPHCGNTRVKNARTMTEEDMDKAKQWIELGLLDPDWLHLFTGKEVQL
jgi:predicted RNA-binding Zn-ribbon protein involved in translation (DUF1610 family)